MNKINFKKVIFLCILCILLVIEFITWGRSKAEDTLKIQVNVVDNDNILSNDTATICVANGGNSGYYILLPRTLNTKIISKYYIEQNSQSEGNNTIPEPTYIQQNVGDTIYLTSAQVSSLSMTLKVTYDKTIVNTTTLYDKILEYQIDSSNKINVEGYMPADAVGNFTEISNYVTDQVINKYQGNLLSGYDIKITSEGSTYLCATYNKTMKVSYNNIDSTKAYQLLSLDDSTNVQSKITDITSTFTIDLSNNLYFTVSQLKSYILIDKTSTNPVSSTLPITQALNIQNVVQAGQKWDGSSISTSFCYGTGTQSNPYLIATGCDLAYLAQQVNNGQTYEGQYFNLVNDIDLNSQSWTPIGTYSTSFRGIFDGEGHTISNCVINSNNSLPSNTMEDYGVFGSIGGGSSRAKIINTQLNNIIITIQTSGRYSGGTQKGYSLGCVVGTMFANSTISNVIVKNSTITANNKITISNNSDRILAGGIAGETLGTSTMNTAPSDPGSSNWYAIDNCYVSANIDLSKITTSSRSYAAQYSVGGIIGRIRTQEVWPTNCLYKGSIKANGFIGPIFGTLLTSGTYGTSQYSAMWDGNNYGNLTCTSYYTLYSANGYNFTQIVTSGTSENNCRVNTRSSNIGYEQGVNKGIYTNNMGSLLSGFNTRSGSNILWTYSNNDFSLIPRISAVIDEPTNFNYKIYFNDPYNMGKYSFNWYINGIKNNSLTGSTAAIYNTSYTDDENITVLISDGTYITIIKFTIPKISLQLTFNVNTTNNSAKAVFSGTASRYISDSDYTYTWSKTDITGINTSEISGETTRTLTNLDPDYTYTLTATNNAVSQLSVKGTTSLVNKTVIYVDDNAGNDSNNGLTTNAAVRSIEQAYKDLPSNGTIYTNIIVIMNDYTYSDYLYATSYTYNSQSQIYTKQVTVTGAYNATNYNPGVYVSTQDTGNGGTYIYADTRFMYLKFYGSTSSYGTGSTFMYVQGHNLTIGQQVTMQRYSTSNRSNALANGNAPDFHVIGGFLNYNLTNLSKENNNGSITINSGTYARIITGSRNTQTNSTSHNFTGTSSNSFNMKVLIDIQNSTTNKSTYPNDINLLVGGQTDGSIYANTQIEVKGGILGRIIGGSIGYSREITGYPSNSYFGSTLISVSGGQINELYGASLGRNRSDVYYYGNIEIDISGGNIYSNIYGAGAGGTTGYDSSSSDPYKSYGQNITTQTTINISGGTITGNVYGAGYGYSAYLDNTTIATDGGALYGNSYVNISGGTLSGNIYGAGRGTSEYSGLTTLAKMKGNSNITLQNTPVISGSIYGAGEGISGYPETARLTGNSNIVSKISLSANIFGGGNIANVTGNANIDIQNGNITGSVYGGGNLGQVSGDSTLNLSGGSINRVYGGGESSGLSNSNVNLNGASVTTIYGGSDSSGNIASSNISLTNGTVTNVYGGNNLGGKTSSTNISLNGATVSSMLYGGGNQSDCDITYMNLQNSSNTVPYIFGGGDEAGTTDSIINVSGASATNLFGGSNTSHTIEKSIVNISGGTIENLYGGNNQGGTTIVSNINVTGGTITNIYGGGEKAQTDTSNIKIGDGTITNIYGGGDKAGIKTSNINLAGGNISNIFGGSNISGNVPQTNVNTQNTILLPASTIISTPTISINITCSASKIQSWQSTTYPTDVAVNVILTNTTNSDINTWNGHFTAAQSVLNNNYSSTDISKVDDTYTFNQVNKYYGTNNIPANGTYSFSFDIYTMQSVSNFAYTYGFGTDPNSNITSDSIKDNNITLSNQALSIQNVYGGNNQGGVTTTSQLNLNYGNIQDVYGGGNQAVTGTTNVNISQEVKGCIYGGGNQADTNTTNVNIDNATIGDNVYGGGNQGKINGDTNIYVKNSLLKNNLYAGGNGVYAIVSGNTNLIMEGTTNVITNSVFGGGNQAATGNSINKNSLSTVNIVGGIIGKNVYGGANTSVVYGSTHVNIGYNVVNNSNLQRGDIKIAGTVFGGGEANASGSETYDFSYISVTDGTNINIDGTGHGLFYIKGSIFGSGNASSSSGPSYISVKSYGTVDAPQRNISIQRATKVTLDSSAIVLTGATDRTNEYSNINFSISRVDNFRLKNNSILYLNCGANLLQNLYSLVDINNTEQAATVTINSDTGDTVKNVDNRIYMYQGKVLNIATNEQVTAYGNVYGMTFLGMYTNTTNPSTSTGLYNRNYQNGQKITNMGTFSSNSYVLAQHKINHETKLDGFYTNINNNNYIKLKYVDVTPPNDVYYIWSIGEQLNVTKFTMTLTASKYVTLGTYELPLTGFSTPNTKFILDGFSSGLNEGISLVDKSEISAIDETGNLADTTFGLSMKSGKKCWQTNDDTDFYTKDGGTYSSSSEYMSENSSYTPSLEFCLYHFQNLSIAQNLGDVMIRLEVLTPKDDLTYTISYIDIDITMTTALYQNDYYEAAITPGKEFNLFNTTETCITNKSTFSTYYSLYIPEFSKSKCYSGYANDKRVLISRLADNSNFVYKANTKLTMLDLVTNTTYYYVVTSQDEQNRKNTYKLSDFKKMGSTNEYYNESISESSYYDFAGDIEHEGFIFQVDFSQSDQTTQIENASLLIELQDQDNQTLIGVLGIQRDTCKYGIYPNSDAIINVDATLSSDTIYLGQTFNMNLATNFTQTIIDSKTIFDTKYFDQKTGIKISVFDNNGNQLSLDSLLGIKFLLNGVTYYPNIDGTIRINVAQRVANILSNITVDTSQNTTLATGTYQIKIESFGSSDGIYYGLTSSATTIKNINIINDKYGLKVWTDDKSKFVTKQTGYTDYGNNTLVTNINYSSALNNPVITVSLQRRDYSSIYSLKYNDVDLKDYVTNKLIQFSTNEYEVSNTPQSSSQFFLNLKAGLQTGTYKLMFKLYDKTTYIGNAEEYFIVK